MNAPALTFKALLRLVHAGLVFGAFCLPLGLSAEKSAESGKAPAGDKAPAADKTPAKDKAPSEPVWYWLKSIDIPANNPLQNPAKPWDRTGSPDLMVMVERNGLKLGVTDVKEDCWTCVYEKKYQNLFGFRQDSGETYTITIFDHDWPDPNDSMLQIVVNGDAFNKDEVVVREKADAFAVKESLVTVTFVRVSKDENDKLQTPAAK